MKLGDNIRKLLEQCDITQKQLAQELSITPAALGNYIHNIREPDYHTLSRIADYFCVSTDFLLGRSDTSQISCEEEMLLRIFRSLSPDQKEFYLEQGKIFIRQNNRKNSSSCSAENSGGSNNC